jgi:hypothetical protein
VFLLLELLDDSVIGVNGQSLDGEWSVSERVRFTHHTHPDAPNREHPKPESGCGGEQ